MKLLGLFLAMCLLLSVFVSGHPDEEKAAPKRTCPCPRNFDPVCASNLITYPNRCMYDCARRDLERSGRSLNLIRSGSC
ncbi:serine protease inhibitor Kazal-type 1 [Drosophila grimshawi]|uniref:GH13067 n=1 Tax=Drosophila grimshawi TaxID=7222 RepID=B4JR36_DROGR|nr:serine protease inhibitor Kazal-type 1 [Drosophila grimshawi]EDV99366.1 GH13067 [Drosophila grimshawi]